MVGTQGYSDKGEFFNSKKIYYQQSCGSKNYHDLDKELEKYFEESVFKNAQYLHDQALGILKAEVISEREEKIKKLKHEIESLDSVTF